VEIEIKESIGSSDIYLVRHRAAEGARHFPWSKPVEIHWRKLPAYLSELGERIDAIRAEAGL
jgi:hypothetical protein